MVYLLYLCHVLPSLYLLHCVRGVSGVKRRRRSVLLIGDVRAPGDGAALVVDLLQGEVGHEARRRGAVPMVLARLEEDAVAGPDHLDRPTAPLRQPNALGDPDRLAVRVGVPRGARARREVDAARAQPRPVRW